MSDDAKPRKGWFIDHKSHVTSASGLPTIATMEGGLRHGEVHLLRPHDLTTALCGQAQAEMPSAKNGDMGTAWWVQPAAHLPSVSICSACKDMIFESAMRAGIGEPE